MTTQLDVRAVQFSNNVLPLAQHEKSLLLPTVMMKGNITGKSFYQDQIGHWTMTPKGAPNADTPMHDPNLSRTRVDMEAYHDNRLLDRTLLEQEMSDPASETTRNVASAVGERIDQVIYNALGGNAYRGETGSTVVTFPNANVIAAGGKGLTVDKIREAAARLDDEHVPAGDRFLVASVAAKATLLSDTTTTSVDFVANKALVSGQIPDFYGFNLVFLPSSFIKKIGNEAEYFAFHRSGVIFGMVGSLIIRTDERADKSYSKQIYYEMSCGAGRLEEAKVIKIIGDESV